MDALARFARYEITYDRLILEGYQSSDRHAFTLDDLKAVLEGLSGPKAVATVFYRDWFDPIQSDHELAVSLGLDDVTDGQDVSLDLPKDERGLLRLVFAEMDPVAPLEGADTGLPFSPRVLLELVEDFKRNQSLAKKDWNYPDFLESRWLAATYRLLLVAPFLASKDDLVLARRWCDNLLGKNDPDALYVKAVSCMYGGLLYPKDERQAYELMLVHYEKNHDFQSACNAGMLAAKLGNWQQAFPLLVFAHLNGQDEATLALADLYWYGRGVRQDLQTAATAIDRVFQDLRDKVEDGNPGVCFPEAAYREGFLWEDGRVWGRDLMNAYACYLEARVALTHRRILAVGYRENDGRIWERIDSALKRMRFALGKDKSTGDGFEILEDFVDAGIARTSTKALKGSMKVRVSLNSGQSWKQCMFVTLPEAGVSLLTDTLEFHAKGGTLRHYSSSDPDGFWEDDEGTISLEGPDPSTRLVLHEPFDIRIGHSLRKEYALARIGFLDHALPVWVVADDPDLQAEDMVHYHLPPLEEGDAKVLEACKVSFWELPEKGGLWVSRQRPSSTSSR